MEEEDDEGSSNDNKPGKENEEEEQIADLIQHFGKLLNKETFIQQQYEQKVTHVSALPYEVIMYICKWIISSELDMRSLEQLALVCRGFYLCARDQELWRLACLRVWGMDFESVFKYQSWRNMFIQRARVKYDGAYISRTTYIRHGENSFQDQFYRPWQLVEYYRYLRFFPDGIALMLTTPDDPYTSLAKLRSRNPKHSAVLVGHYQLHGSSVIATLKRSKRTETSFERYRDQRHNSTDMGQQIFHVELELKDYRKKSNCQLVWLRYASHISYRNGQENISDFDLVQNKFPPFWFSRVKSYTAKSETPL